MVGPSRWRWWRTFQMRQPKRAIAPGDDLLKLLPLYVAVTTSGMLGAALSGNLPDWRLFAAVALASIAIAAFTVAVTKRIELTKLRRNMGRLDRETGALLKQAQARARGEGEPRDEATIDAELAQLRERSIARYGLLANIAR